jgi:hypothetical protein
LKTIAKRAIRGVLIVAGTKKLGPDVKVIAH